MQDWCCYGLDEEVANVDALIQNIQSNSSCSKTLHIDLILRFKSENVRQALFAADQFFGCGWFRTVECHFDIDASSSDLSAADLVALLARGHVRRLYSIGQSLALAPPSQRCFVEVPFQDATNLNLDLLRRAGWSGVQLTGCTDTSPVAERAVVSILRNWINLDDPTFPVEPFVALLGGIATGEPTREWLHVHLGSNLAGPLIGGVNIGSGALVDLCTIMPSIDALSDGIRSLIDDVVPISR